MSKIRLRIFAPLKKLSAALMMMQATALYSQVVTISPPFATQGDNITVTYDASKGNAALAGQSVVYAHAGVITDKSTTSSDWKYVQGTWGTDDAKVKMTNAGNNKFTLSYNINTFYGIPAGEKVLKLAFVFRNASGNLVGRSDDGGDIFVPLSTGGFRLLFSSPSAKNTILDLNDSLVVSATTSSKANLKLYVNDVLVQDLPGDSIVHYTVHAGEVKKYRIRLDAVSGANTYSDSVGFVVRRVNTAVPPAGVVDGINYISNTSVVLQLFAPYKSFVYAIGDFSNWELAPEFDMNRTPDGNRYWVQIDNLVAGKEYRFQYLIDQAQLKIADPYADKQLDPYNDPSINAATYPGLIAYPAGKTTEYVSVLQAGQAPFAWQHTAGFIKPAKEKMVIYELLVRDFTGAHSYQVLKDTLDYLQRLGVNVIELMPVNEFEGNESWGYNTVFYFAPDKYYGPKEKLKELIDECHRRGMAVITDMVLNHSFGQSSMVRMYFDQASGKPASNNPWFNADATHPYNVGYDFNHESPYTKALVDTVLKYWLREYHIDGYRFDLSKGFTQKNSGSDVNAWSVYDPTRVAIWKRIYDEFRSDGNDCYMILEHFADNTEQKILSDYGFMLWGNMNHAFNEATMGYSSDLSGASYTQYGWSAPNLVSYMESHDEERLMYKNISFGGSNAGYNAKDTAVALARNEAAALIYFTVPGPKMIWQFGELGYDYSIDFNGRVGNKPIRWDYLGNPRRKKLYDIYAALAHLKTQDPAFATSNFSYTLSGNYKTVKLDGASMKVLAMANFSLTANTQKPGFVKTGWWYEYFTGDSVFINAIDTSVALKPGEYRMYTDVRLAKPVITPVTGMEEQATPDVTVYPNPAASEVYFDLPFTAGKEPVHVSVCDLGGKEALHITEPHSGSGKYLLGTGDLAPGIYFMKITKGSQQITRKLIIQTH